MNEIIRQFLARGRTRPAILLALCSLAAPTAPAATPVSGMVSGTWAASGSPYIVEATVTIAAGTQLTIEPGVRVQFETNTSLQVFGSLTAIGNASNRIVFTSNRSAPAPGDWTQIRVDAATPPPDVSLDFCRIEFARWGFNAVVFGAASNNLAQVQIRNSTVHSCSLYGVSLYASGSVAPPATTGSFSLLLENCRVYSNWVGISCSAQRGGPVGATGAINGAIRNTELFANSGPGISMISAAGLSLPAILNNTIWGNQGAGLTTEALRDRIQNNIIVSNALGITASRVEGSPAVSFNNVWANAINWSAAASPYAAATGNLSLDPLCADPASGDFHLRSEAGRYSPAISDWVFDTASSPCIDAGDPAADFFLEPEPNGGRINMGAHGGTAWAAKGLPRLAGAISGNGDLVLSWSSVPGESYQVVYSASPSGPWLTDLPGSTLTAGPGQTTLAFTNLAVGTKPNRFFRVRWDKM